MNFLTIGMFSLNIQGIKGSILLMLSHGLVSSVLFLCVDVLYDRHKIQLILTILITNVYTLILLNISLFGHIHVGIEEILTYYVHHEIT